MIGCDLLAGLGVDFDLLIQKTKRRKISTLFSPSLTQKLASVPRIRIAPVSCQGSLKHGSISAVCREKVTPHLTLLNSAPNIGSRETRFRTFLSRVWRIGRGQTHGWICLCRIQRHTRC